MNVHIKRCNSFILILSSFVKKAIYYLVGQVLDVHIPVHLKLHFHLKPIDIVSGGRGEYSDTHFVPSEAV